MESIFDWWLIHVALPMRFGRTLRALMRPKSVPAHATISDGPFVPTERRLTQPVDPDALEEQLGCDAHVRALREMKRVADEQGVGLVRIDLGYSRRYPEAVRGAALDRGYRKL